MTQPEHWVWDDPDNKYSNGWYIVLTEVAEHYVHFDVWQCQRSTNMTGDPIVLYHGGNTESRVHSATDIHGSLKWDGCMDWSGDVIHTCSRVQVAALGKLLTELHDFAARHIEAWDGDEEPLEREASK